MQILGNVITAISAIVGVVIGGLLTFRAQRFNFIESTKASVKRDERDACAAYLAACRKYRRFVQYSDIKAEEIESTSKSRGTVIIEGSQPFESETSDAMAKVLIVVQSGTIHESAISLSRQLGLLLRVRVREGKGMIPTDIVHATRDAEESFAALVRRELSR